MNFVLAFLVLGITINNISAHGHHQRAHTNGRHLHHGNTRADVGNSSFFNASGLFEGNVGCLFDLNANVTVLYNGTSNTILAFNYNTGQGGLLNITTDNLHNYLSNLTSLGNLFTNAIQNGLRFNLTAIPAEVEHFLGTIPGFGPLQRFLGSVQRLASIISNIFGNGDPQQVLSTITGFFSNLAHDLNLTAIPDLFKQQSPLGDLVNGLLNNTLALNSTNLFPIIRALFPNSSVDSINNIVQTLVPLLSNLSQGIPNFINQLYANLPNISAIIQHLPFGSAINDALTSASHLFSPETFVNAVSSFFGALTGGLNANGQIGGNPLGGLLHVGHEFISPFLPIVKHQDHHEAKHHPKDKHKAHENHQRRENVV